MEMYQHSPLPGADYIRILVVQPAADLDEPIVCKLKVAQQKSTPRYVALSYSWATEDGDSTLSREIYILGKAFMVSQTLHDGLRRLRKKRGQISLWADAVCFDQQNPDELRQQVPKMANIYANASWTAIWLGEERPFERTQLVFDMFKPARTLPDWVNPIDAFTVHPAVKEVDLPSEEDPAGSEFEEFDREFDRAQYLESCRQILTSLLDPGSKRFLASKSPVLQELVWSIGITYIKLMHRVWDFLHFMNRRFWSRKWIVQEVCMSKDRRILCGHLRFRVGATFKRDADRLVSAFQALSSLLLEKDFQDDVFHDASAYISHALQRCAFLVSLFEDRLRPEGGIETLLQALITFQGSKCSDPRDALYSFLSFDETISALPNYSKSSAEVFTEFAGRAIESNQGHWVFSSNHQQKSTTNWVPGAGLPSWVPDLGLSITVCMIGLPWTPPENMTIEGGSTLVCQVWFVGTVGVVHPNGAAGQIIVNSPDSTKIISPNEQSTDGVVTSSSSMPMDRILQEKGEFQAEFDVSKVKEGEDLDRWCEGDHLYASRPVNHDPMDDLYRSILLLREAGDGSKKWLLKGWFGSLFLKAAVGGRPLVLPWDAEEVLIRID